MQIPGLNSMPSCSSWIVCRQAHVNKPLTVGSSAQVEFLRMGLAAGQREGAVPVSSCLHRAQNSSRWVSGSL